MYKLLATTAIIVATASPSLAWDNAKDIINDLGTIYTSVDGTDEFNNLQADGGALNTFVTTVNQGVTHVTLEVGTDFTISASATGGVTMNEILDSSDDLINRVSFDLFNDNGTDTYDNTVDYGNFETAITSGTGIDQGQEYANSHVDGLVGARINSIVSDTNLMNDFLTNNTTSQADAEALTTAINDKAAGTHGGVDTGVFASNISNLNIAITTAGTGGFFSDVNTDSLTNSTVDLFKVDGLHETNGTVTDGDTTYSSLLDWAINS